MPQTHVLGYTFLLGMSSYNHFQLHWRISNSNLDPKIMRPKQGYVGNFIQVVVFTDKVQGIYKVASV